MLGWDRASGCLDSTAIRPTPGQVRVLFFLDQKCQTTYETTDPVESLCIMAFDTKNPSAATHKGRVVSKAYYKHRLPQARCSVGSLFFRLPVAAEGRLKSYFANSL